MEHIERRISFISRGGSNVEIKLGNSDLIQGLRFAEVTVDGRIFPRGEAFSDDAALEASLPRTILPQARSFLGQERQK